MESSNQDTAAKRFTPFQVIITGLVLLSLGLNLFMLVTLWQTRNKAQAMLTQAATHLNEVAEGHIQHTFHISQTLPISTNISINENIRAPVSLVVSNTIPVNGEIPIRKKIIVPVDLKVDQVFPVDTTVPFKDEI